jgi:hypothetical protein
LATRAVVKIYNAGVVTRERRIGSWVRLQPTAKLAENETLQQIAELAKILPTSHHSGKHISIIATMMETQLFRLKMKVSKSPLKVTLEKRASKSFSFKKENKFRPG